MCVQLGVQVGQQDWEFEWFGDIVVCVVVEVEDGIGIGIMFGQYDDGVFYVLFVQLFVQFVFVSVGQVYVKDDQIVDCVFGVFDGFVV